MRKAFTNFGNSSPSLLAPFVREGLGGGLSDAREKAVPVMAKVGHPNGEVNVPGKKGWYWAQRPDPSGLLGAVGVVIQFYAASDEDGEPKSGFTVGQGVILRQTNDTQPTYYMLVGDVSDSYTMGSLTLEGCTTVDGNYHRLYPAGYEDASLIDIGLWPNTGNPTTGTSATYPLRTYGAALGISSTKYKTTPKRRPLPPSVPNIGDLWQDSSNETVYRYEGEITSVSNVGKWYVQQGPNSGVFVSRKVLSAVVPGKVVYEVLNGSGVGDYADLADNTNDACWGKVIGVAIETRSANQFCLIQQSGDLKIANSFVENIPLYLGTSGNLSATPPAAGSGHLLQRIAVTTARFGPTPGYRISLGNCIKRR